METTDTIALAISRSAIPTVLFLGAGGSIDSGAPSAAVLANALSGEFFPGDKQRALADIASRVELRYGREKLVQFLREMIEPLNPSATVKQLPNFNFANIFTTNYDRIIEKSFEGSHIDLPTVRSNKDYSFDYRQYNTVLFKLHGSIEEDRADGLNYGMIITDEDYATYDQYRQIGFKSFEQSLSTSNIVFVGYSLADSNIKEYVDRAISLSGGQDCPGQIYLILYENDELEALRWENRGLKVAFGSLDNLLASLATVKQRAPSVGIFSPISTAPRHIVAAAISSLNPSDEARKAGNLRRLIAGGEVSYGDIRAGNAFGRSASTAIAQQILSSSGPSIHVVLGPSGSGKTGVARLALANLAERGVVCYEHKSNIGMDLSTWQDVDAEHHAKGERACLFLDEANASQFAINKLAESVTSGHGHALSLVVTYHPSIWNYRTKSVALVRRSIIHNLARLTPSDVRSIATHVKNSANITKLLSADIQSKNHNDLVNIINRKSGSDLFVSLKYLFETKSLDEIVLKEFDKLGKEALDRFETNVQQLYSIVSFLEACGRYVHRQMVMRLANININELPEILEFFEGTIFESERDDQVEGIYVWHTRHQRIASIIAESKFSRADRRNVIERVVRSINPASKVERQFCSQLCNSELGIESLPAEDQTELYRLLSDSLPGERIPRHRLIRNLIRQKRFGEAEIAISEARDMKINDSVIHRYDVSLDVARAENLAFLEDVDKLNLLETAISKATKSISRRQDDMYNYESLCKASLAFVLNGGDLGQLEEAVTLLKEAYQLLGDELMLDWITKYDSELLRLRRQRE